jgi:hypothetical protein
MKFLVSSAFFLVSPVIAFANCPLPSTVVYHCYDWGDGNKICTWGPMNGWYQGSADYAPGLTDGAKAVDLIKAIWYPYPDENGEMGTTNCFYKGPEGETFNLFQQTAHGEVPKPTGRNWLKDNGESGFTNALACYQNSRQCDFDFGERL